MIYLYNVIVVIAAEGEIHELASGELGLASSGSGSSDHAGTPLLGSSRGEVLELEEDPRDQECAQGPPSEVTR